MLFCRKALSICIGFSINTINGFSNLDLAGQLYKNARPLVPSARCSLRHTINYMQTYVCASHAMICVATGAMDLLDWPSEGCWSSRTLAMSQMATVVTKLILTSENIQLAVTATDLFADDAIYVLHAHTLQV